MKCSGDVDEVATNSGCGSFGKRKRHVICMVSDFFYPNVGGVESAIYQLSQCLLRHGHKVVVITHSYGNHRLGVRYVTNGLKVYYLPNKVMARTSTLPTIHTTLPLFRYIYRREKVTIVHGHTAFSVISTEGILHARTMGLPAVFTDHSLFGFNDISSILVNKVLQFTMCDVSHVICVSHTSKENTVLRAGISPTQVSTIPNAVDTNVFVPDTTTRKSDRISIVVISRLVYRKGIDLLAELIPRVCADFPEIEFLIGGDGDKRVLLEEVRERNQLDDRVEMLGMQTQAQVKALLNRGHIFLNTSLTEAFCIAITEAASCGLLVVSTNVGGIPEVLPDGLVHLADPTADSLYIAVERALRDVRSVDAHHFHRIIRDSYDWEDVARRTEIVYDTVCAIEQPTLAIRFSRYYSCGSIAGPVFVIMAAIDYLLLLLCNWLVPEETIDIAADWPTPDTEGNYKTAYINTSDNNLPP